MPANKKYLLKTRWARTSKILAVTLGGMFTTLSLHVALMMILNMKLVLATAFFSIFIVWPLFMLMVYSIKKPWVSWAILIGITLFSGAIIYTTKIVT